MKTDVVGHAGHACGIIRKLKNDNRMIFFGGGRHVYQSKYGGGSAVGSGYNDKRWDLDDESFWRNVSGLEAIDGLYWNSFENLTPYEGFIFSNGILWHIWNATAFQFEPAPTERDTGRTYFATANIPKTSPMVKNCLK